MPKISLQKVRSGSPRGDGAVREEIAFSPDNAVDRLARSAPYRADREALRYFFGVTVVTFSFPLSP